MVQVDRLPSASGPSDPCSVSGGHMSGRPRVRSDSEPPRPRCALRGRGHTTRLASTAGKMISVQTARIKRTNCSRCPFLLRTCFLATRLRTSATSSSKALQYDR